MSSFYKIFTKEKKCNIFEDAEKGVNISLWSVFKITSPFVKQKFAGMSYCAAPASTYQFLDFSASSGNGVNAGCVLSRTRPAFHTP